MMARWPPTRSAAGNGTAAGAGKTVGAAMDTKITLTEQERGKELAYVVVAMNKVGEGVVSNTVMAVL
uniref:Fibronectin type-III domain-containing protein n=1 Tax=Candidatus Kentrum sp. FM TaxID=2126340 RepID=A0A450TSL0_9GAMM|nr:MAG: hypothetical protein BECKFM1743C_GA0114222_105995 [Candidatus Kentron sp. FM]VFJ71660.1 MAG: hypothetical protein BECKFM1743A_GA0114220_105995 [Candidatus Kentron sp. FM]VFK19626.1 MAG: hypothetical protein BECKFM1743B_GA0114221_106335 [Candidatus Kentron sp. FM]